MTENSHTQPESDGRPPEAPGERVSEPVRFLRSAVGFAVVGLLLYGALYVASERLIDRYAQRNRFFLVNTAPRTEYDHVILGASHAVVMDARDMNARLEEMTGRTILNLATVGAGVTVNELLLDYFLADHETRTVVYVLDSFGFYSRQWNEERLRDARLFLRAPWDPALARLLLATPPARPAAIDYITGFSKINNADRFKPDLHEQEGPRFERAYRPVEQIDRHRIAYLYAGATDTQSLATSPYFARFEGWIGELQSRGIRFLIVRPPIPARIRAMIPNEAVFDRALKALAARRQITLDDFSTVNNQEEFFFDSDHLNHDGVLSFFENHLAAVLRAAGEDH